MVDKTALFKDIPRETVALPTTITTITVKLVHFGPGAESRVTRCYCYYQELSDPTVSKTIYAYVGFGFRSAPRATVRPNYRGDIIYRIAPLVAQFLRIACAFCYHTDVLLDVSSLSRVAARGAPPLVPAAGTGIEVNILGYR